MIKSNTCLAVLRVKDKLYFAGDRRISWGMHKAQITPRPKITLRNKILFAGTGVSALCDEVTDLFNVPSRPVEQDTFHYFHNLLLPAVIDHLTAKGYVAKGERHLKRHDKKGGSDLHSVILVGIGSDLFEMDISDDIISGDIIQCPYAAGCGGSYALGSLLTTEKLKLTPEKRLRLALQVAATISPGCDDNIDILHN